MIYAIFLLNENENTEGLANTQLPLTTLSKVYILPAILNLKKYIPLAKCDISNLFSALKLDNL